MVGQPFDVLARCHQPAAPLGALGPDDREHRGECSGRYRVDRPDRAGDDSPRRTQQRLGRVRLTGGSFRTGGCVMQIEMTIKGLMLDPVTTMPILILRDENGQRMLPIWIGPNEAQAIASQIENVAPPAADDARPAARRDSDAGWHGPEGGRLRSEGQHLLTPSFTFWSAAIRSPLTRVPATPLRWRCALRPRSSSRNPSSTTPRAWNRRPTAPIPSGCRSGWKASTRTTSANTRCDPPARPGPRRLRSFMSSFANLCNHACRPS